MITIFDRYVLAETLKTLAAFILVLVLIVLGSNFVRYLEKVAAGNLPSSILFEVIAIEMVRVLALLIPAAVFFSVLLSLGRMYRDSEIMIMEGCGLGPLRMFRSVLAAALPVALLVAWLAADVLPWGNRMIQLLKQQATGTVAALNSLSPGRFNESPRGDTVVYIEQMDFEQKRMRNIFVQNREQGRIGLVSARTGYLDVDPASNDVYVVLENGRRYEGTPGQNDYRIGSFRRYSVRVSEGRSEPLRQLRKALPTRQLLASSDIREQAEAQYRLIQPLLVLAFAVLALPLARSQPRQGIFGRMVLAFVVYFLFLNLQGVSFTLMEDKITPAWLGLWWVPAAMFLLAAMMLLLQSGVGGSWRARLGGRRR